MCWCFSKHIVPEMASLMRSARNVRNLMCLARRSMSIVACRHERTFLQSKQILANGLKLNYSTVYFADKIQADLHWLSRKFYRHDRITRNDINGLLKTVKDGQAGALNSEQCVMLIRCLGKPFCEEAPQVRLQMVMELWNDLLRQNLRLNIAHYNALLSVFNENQHTFSPAEFLASLEAKDLTPDRETYLRLIEQYCQQGNMKDASQMLVVIKEKDITVDERFFNALIVGYTKSGQFDLAVGVSSTMELMGLEPDIEFLYTNVLCGYAKLGDLDSIHRTLGQCKTQGIDLSDRNILEVIHELAFYGHSNKIEQLLGYAKKWVEFNQDAFSVILRLVSQGFDESAIVVLKSMIRDGSPDDAVARTGDFLIKQMVKRNRPLEEVKTLCGDLVHSGLNPNAFITLRQAILHFGSTDSALAILREELKATKPAKEDIFWPLLRLAAANGDIGKLLKNLDDEFDYKPNARTIRDQVVRNMDLEYPYWVVENLKNANVSISTAVSSVVYNFLMQQQLKKAYELASLHEVFLNPSFFQEPMISALEATNDVESYVKIVRYIYENYSKKVNHESVAIDEANVANVLENSPNLIYSTLSALTANDRLGTFTQILKGLVNQGLTISKKEAERIRSDYDSAITAEMASLLTQLASGQLKPAPMKKTKYNISFMASGNLDQFIKLENTRGNDTTNLSNWLLTAYLREGNISKYDEHVKKLESDNILITQGTYREIIKILAYSNHLDNALETFEKVRAKYPKFVLNTTRTLTIALSLLQNNQYEKASHLLETNKTSTSHNHDEATANLDSKLCWKMLNMLAEAGKQDDLQKIFDSLTTKNYVKLSNTLLGPLVRIHLNNGDVNKAVDVFQALAKMHKMTPLQGELTHKLILNDDQTNLQRVTDSSSKIHGKDNSRLKLAFSYIECGRIESAQEILETPDLNIKFKLITQQCERYAESGNVDHLEGLATATRYLQREVNRPEIFYNLLSCYCSADLPDKALGLWKRMQEENEIPSDDFLLKLGRFLKQKDIQVPFEIPAVSSTKLKTVKAKPGDIQESTTLNNFEKALNGNKIGKIRGAYSQLLPTDEISTEKISLFISKLVKADDLSLAQSIIVKMLKEQKRPGPNTLRLFLYKLGAKGDVQSLHELAPLMSDELKKYLSFNNFVCNAYETSGREDDLLENINADLESADSEESRTKMAYDIPFGGILNLLCRKPAVLPKIENMASKWTTKNDVTFQNILWGYHLIAGNKDACKKIWNDHLQSTSSILFSTIMIKAKKEQNILLASNVIEFLKTSSKISQREIGSAYSLLLDTYCEKGQFESALETLNAICEEVSLKSLDLRILIRIKKGIEAEGKVFPYAIQVQEKMPSTKL